MRSPTTWASPRTCAARSPSSPARWWVSAAGQGVDGGYNTEFFACPASDLANFVRPFPSEWILPNYQGVSDEALDYFRPLIQGEPKLICENGIPVTMRPFNRR